MLIIKVWTTSYFVKFLHIQRLSQECAGWEKLTLSAEEVLNDILLKILSN